MSETNKDVLIGLLPNRKDLSIAYKSNWYRIPVSSRLVPKYVKNQTIKLIAFYLPKIFGDDAFCVKYYGIVKEIKIVKRKSLFRSEPPNPKSENKYYKINFEKLLRLPKPIYSRKKRRILFISTTIDRFENASEINDLYYESPLEEKLWAELRKAGITAERQYFEEINKNYFYLDFAIFCRHRNLAIECDGDKYHTNKAAIQKDKRRDNLLGNRGWNVFRYTTNDIEYRLNDSLLQIKDTINKYGGIEAVDDDKKFHYLVNNYKKDSLFGMH